MSLKYEPSSEPLHIYVKQLFLNFSTQADVNARDHFGVAPLHLATFFLFITLDTGPMKALEP